MPQLHTFFGTDFGDVQFPMEISCPVPDWENGVLRAYSQEEQRTIRNWYVDRGLAKPLEEIISSQKARWIKTEEGNKPILTDGEFKEFMETLEENKRIDMKLEEKRRSRLQQILEGENHAG